MILLYENACKEAGLTEEEIKKIRRIFDADNKRYRRDKEAREKAGIVFNSLSAYEDEFGSLSIKDPHQEDVEDRILHEIELENLRVCLKELPEDDRGFLFKLFGGRGSETALAKELGVSRASVQRRKARLIKLLRKMMKEEV